MFNTRQFAAGWIILSGVCSVLLNYLTQFHAIVIAFITFLSSSLCAAIIGAISVSLFPTNVRAMATCFIFMFGRIGGLVGGNLVGLLVETKCNVIFNVFFVLSLGRLAVFPSHFFCKTIQCSFRFFQLVRAFFYL